MFLKIASENCIEETAAVGRIASVRRPQKETGFLLYMEFVVSILFIQ